MASVARVYFPARLREIDVPVAQRLERDQNGIKTGEFPFGMGWGWKSRWVAGWTRVGEEPCRGIVRNSPLNSSVKISGCLQLNQLQIQSRYPLHRCARDMSALEKGFLMSTSNANINHSIDSFFLSCVSPSVRTFISQVGHSSLCASIHSSFHSFIRSFVRSFIHSFIHTFIHTFIHSVSQSVSQTISR